MRDDDHMEWHAFGECDGVGGCGACEGEGPATELEELRALRAREYIDDVRSRCADAGPRRGAVVLGTIDGMLRAMFPLGGER